MAIEQLPRYLQLCYLDEIPEPNRQVLVSFLYDLIVRDNVAVMTKVAYAKTLLYLMRAVKHKPIAQIDRNDLMSYLQSLRKTIEADPKQKWITSYNHRAQLYAKFFKWLFDPQTPSKERKTPDIVKDIPTYKKKEKTTIKATDLWTPHEDAIFLAHCQDERLSFYHMLSLDTSGRPAELLRLRIGDIKIKYAGEKMYAEVEIGRGGKTKSRTVPLILSLPFFKSLLANKHPEPYNPNSFIFRSLDKKRRYKNVAFLENTLNALYRNLKVSVFPQLLQRPDLPPEEKIKIEGMLQKPWNPYIRRHTSLTEKAKILNEYALRLHAGWTKTSKMVEVYTHELGGESSALLLEAYGIKPKESTVMSILQPKICPLCSEPNKPQARFCAKEHCGYPLTVEAALESQQQRDAEKQAEEERRFIELSKKYGILDKAMVQAQGITKGHVNSQLSAEPANTGDWTIVYKDGRREKQL